MKARVKGTQNIIDVHCVGEKYGVYADKNGFNYKASELDFDVPQEEQEDVWAVRRYEIAKAVLPFMWLDDGQAQHASEANGKCRFEYKNDQMLAKEAVQLADALIAELRKGGKQ